MGDLQPYESSIERAVDEANKATSNANAESEELAGYVPELDESIDELGTATSGAISAKNRIEDPMTIRYIRTVTRRRLFVQTMSATTKGTARLGDGLSIDGDVLSMNAIPESRIHEVTGV